MREFNKNIFKKPVLLLALGIIFIMVVAKKRRTPIIALPKNMIEALNIAGNNSTELEKVLKKYSKPEDSLKFRAACYLIESLQWHKSQVKEIQFDSNFLFLLREVDKMYFQLAKGKSVLQLESNGFKLEMQKLKRWTDLNLRTGIFKEPKIILSSSSDVSDLNFITSDFIIEQIENAFYVRKYSQLVKKLSFEDFCEFIIPFKYFDNQFQQWSGYRIFKFFNKYLGNINKDSLPEIISRYNVTIKNFQTVLGEYPFHDLIGFEQLLFKHHDFFFDCFHISNYGSVVLNACGVPNAVEYNVAYKHISEKHSYCSIPSECGSWSIFSLESSVPKSTQFKIDDPTDWMNLFRVHFSAEKNSPFFLVNKDEYLPIEFAEPFIEDVSSKRIRTIPLVLPFTGKTQNHLAYLATFNSIDSLKPVTWGIIDKKNNSVDFKNVVLNRLYFPIYYKNSVVTPFGPAFFLMSDTMTQRGYRIINIGDSVDTNKENIKVIITEKYPMRQKFTDLAKGLVGSFVIGSANSNFVPSDTLGKINFIPKPTLQDWKLKINRPYRFYKICIPPSPKHIFGISEISLLTLTKYHYSNTTPISAFYNQNFTQNKNETKCEYVQLIDSSSDIVKRTLCDEDMTTSPKDITEYKISLKEPRIISALRFSPVNDANKIVTGDTYILYEWNNKNWSELSSTIAKSNFLVFDNLSKGILYWLKDVSHVHEEMPFFINIRRKQEFIYDSFPRRSK